MQIAVKGSCSRDVRGHVLHVLRRRIHHGPTWLANAHVHDLESPSPTGIGEAQQSILLHSRFRLDSYPARVLTRGGSVILKFLFAGKLLDDERFLRMIRLGSAWVSTARAAQPGAVPEKEEAETRHPMVLTYVAHIIQLPARKASSFHATHFTPDGEQTPLQTER